MTNPAGKENPVKLVTQPGDGGQAAYRSQAHDTTNGPELQAPGPDLTHLTDAELLAAAIVAPTPPLNGSAPASAYASPGPDPDPLPLPPLPEEARLDPAIGAGAGRWLDRYCSYARAVSPMTPVIMHESAGLWLGSVAIARRLKLPMAFGDIYPNVFALWLATTTLWHKSTALDVAKGLARAVFPHLLAPQDTTPEGFLSDLSGREPAGLADMPDGLKDLWRQERNYAAQRGLVLDELSGLMAGAGKDYNAGLLEAFLRFYDCDPLYTRSTRGAGRVVVRNAYLSILGASTPAAMAPHMANETLWSNGWWARFALLTPDAERPTWETPTEANPQEYEALKARLRGLYDDLPAATWPDPPEARPVILGPGVMAAWGAYDKALMFDLLTPDLDTRLWGSYGRLPSQALKVAVILAALDWRSKDGSTPVIELPHMARAMAITESWRASTHRAITQATASDFDRLQKRVLRQVSRFEPNGASLRDLHKNILDKTPAELRDTVEQLLSVGLLEEIRPQPGPQGGRPTIRYRLVR